MFNVGQLGATISADRRPFDRTLQGVFTTGARRMRRLGQTMTRALTLPLIAFGGASVKAFADFDQAMTESTAIMDGVTKGVRADMEAAARSVSEELAISSTDAAESYFFLASAGLDAQQSIQALPQVARFAQAGMFDMAKATDLATDAQSALGLTVDDAAKNLQNMKRVTDVLVKANTLANASVQQFSESLTNRAAAALRAANKEVEEGVAVLAAFADQGIKGQYAGEQLARIMRILSQAAADNREEFEELGIIDAEGNLTNFADIIEALTDDLGGLSNTAQSARLEQLGFTARVQASIKPLLGTADAIREYQRGLEGAAGITGEVADKQMASLTNQFTVLWNTIVNGAQAIGASLVDTFDIKGLVQGFQESVKSAVEAFNALPEETRRMAFKVAGLIGAGGPILLALGTLTSALAAISWPVVLGVAAFGGAVAAITTHWDSIVAYFTTGEGAGVWAAIKEGALAVWESLKELFSSAGDLISTFSSEWGSDVTGIITKSVSIIAEAVDTIIESLTLVINLLRGDWAAAWESFKDAATTNIRELDKEMFRSMSSMAQSATAVTNLLTGNFDAAFEQFKHGFGFDSVYSEFRREMGDNAGAVEDFAASLMSTDFGQLSLGRPFGPQDLYVSSPGGKQELQDKVNEDIDSIYDQYQHRLTKRARLSVPIEVETDKLFTGLDAAFTSVRTEMEKMMDGVDLDLGDKMFPPGSLGFLEQKLAQLREALRMAVDPAVISRLQNKIGLTREQINALTEQTKESGGALAGFAQTIGNIFQQAVIHSKELGSVLASIGKQLASKAFTTALGFLFNAFAPGTGFFTAMFGGSFHSGGIVPGSGEKLAMVQGGEGVFTPAQMRAMGNQGGGSQRIHITGEFRQRGTDLVATFDEVRHLQSK